MENELTKIAPETKSIELTNDERSRLNTVESVIEQNLGSIGHSFFLIGESFKTIRDQKLWRSGYKNFEDYVHQRWDWSGARASQIISYYDIKMALPENARELIQNPGQAAALKQAPEVSRADILIGLHTRGEIITAQKIYEVIGLPPQRENGDVGAPIDFRGLRNAPINENGVVFLFGLVAKDLGFSVKLVRAGFPDCLAERMVSKNKWRQVRIEFEFESKNFDYHGHDPKGCDIIVCWEHNWKDCPTHLEIIELKKAIMSPPLLGK